jgi:hypothetical protein
MNERIKAVKNQFCGNFLLFWNTCFEKKLEKLCFVSVNYIFSAKICHFLINLKNRAKQNIGAPPLLWGMTKKLTKNIMDKALDCSMISWMIAWMVYWMIDP